MLLLDLRRVSGVCLLGGALAAGCGSSSDDNPLAPGTSGSAAYLRAVVDGVSWSAAPSLIVATRDVAVGAVSLNGTFARPDATTGHPGGHSARRATAGSTRSARRMGIHVAATPVATRTIAAAANASGSYGPTPAR